MSQLQVSEGNDANVVPPEPDLSEGKAGTLAAD